MIKITVVTKEYTREELRRSFSKYSEKDEDFEFWLSALQETGQIKEVKANIFKPSTKRKTTPKPKKSIIEIRPQKEYTDKQLKGKISVFQWTRRAKTKEPRIAIRAGASWVEKRGTPTKATLLSVFKNGIWMKIPEEPKLNPAKPRYPATKEAYRSEIPAAIMRKYNITKNTPVIIRLERMEKGYISELKLAGYEVQAMITFGHTGKHEGDRNLELHGFDFYYKTDGHITDEMEKRGDKIIGALKEWLRGYEAIYYDIFFGKSGINIEENKSPIEGLSETPYDTDIKKLAKIEFRETKRTGRLETIAKANATLPVDWYDLKLKEIADLFESSQDSIGGAHSPKTREQKAEWRGKKKVWLSNRYRPLLKNKQTTLDRLLKSGKTAEGFKKRKR